MSESKGNPFLVVIAIIAILVAATVLILVTNKKSEDTKPTPASETTTETVETTPGSIIVTDFDGNQYDINDFGDKVVILDFWATWCGPCKHELPFFQKLYDNYKDEGLLILGIALDNKGASVVKPFLKKNNLTFPVALPTRELFTKYDSPRSIPTTYIINREGKIVETIVGARDYGFWEGKIKPLLAE